MVDLIWKDWKPGDRLYVVGWEAPDGERRWSLSPRPGLAGWLPSLSDLAGTGLPEAAARVLLTAYENDGEAKCLAAPPRPLLPCGHPTACDGMAGKDGDQSGCGWCADLIDLSMLTDHLSRTYMHFSRGRISKPNTLPEEVFSVAEDFAQEEIEEAVKAAMEAAAPPRPWFYTSDPARPANGQRVEIAARVTSLKKEVYYAEYDGEGGYDFWQISRGGYMPAGAVYAWREANESPPPLPEEPRT